MGQLLQMTTEEFIGEDGLDWQEYCRIYWTEHDDYSEEDWVYENEGLFND